MPDKSKSKEKKRKEKLLKEVRVHQQLTSQQTQWKPQGSGMISQKCGKKITVNLEFSAQQKPSNMRVNEKLAFSDQRNSDDFVTNRFQPKKILSGVILVEKLSQVTRNTTINDDSEEKYSNYQLYKIVTVPCWV